MQIELAAVEDAEAVADMWVDLATEQTQYGSHVLADGNRGVVRDEVTRHAVTDRLVVAKADGTDVGPDGIVGFVMFSVDRGTYEMEVTQGVVENIFVTPDRRNEGIGADLLAAAERRLERLGADTVVLEAMADNLDARRFYRRQGYDTHRVQLEKPVPEGPAKPPESDNHSREGR